MKSSLRSPASTLLAAALLAGCTLGPQRPPLSTITVPPRLAESRGVSPAAPPDAWWRLYRDPALDALVQTALREDRDLRAAAANLLAAQSALSDARGAWWPSTTLTSDAGYGSTLQDQIAAASAGSDHIRTGQRYEIGGGLSWELDLFGRIHASVRIAKARLLASAAVEDGLRVEVAAGVTASYLQACSFAHRAQLAGRALAVARQMQAVTARLLAAGSGQPADLLQAEALTAEAEAALPPLEAGRQAALSTLAILLGQPPEAVPQAAADCTQLPAIAAPLPIGDGLALLRRRPDVRDAEQRLAAQTAQIGLSMADLFPRLSLDDSADVSSPSIGGIGTRNNLVWRVGPLLNWSFPDLGAARARIRGARAGEMAALASYDATILKALHEVNARAAAYAAAQNRLGALRIVAERAAQADRLERIARAEGAATALEALDAARQELEAEAAVAAAEADVAAAQVSLFKALGGGWQAAPPVLMPKPERPVSIAVTTAFPSSEP